MAHVAGYLVTDDLRRLLTKFTVFASDERPADRSIKLHGDIFYHCDNIEAPAVGDIRVQFSYAGKSGDTVSWEGEGERREREGERERRERHGELGRGGESRERTVSWEGESRERW